MTTPKTQLPEVLAIVQGCESILDAAKNIAGQQLNESALHDSEATLHWATDIEEVAMRLHRITSGFLELAEVAVVAAAQDRSDSSEQKVIDAEQATGEHIRPEQGEKTALENLDEQMDEPDRVTEEVAVVAQDDLDQISGDAVQVADDHSKTEQQTPLLDEQIDQLLQVEEEVIQDSASADTLLSVFDELVTIQKTDKQERIIKPRYNKRQLEVVKRIIERIKPGEEFRQSQLNAEDLEGLTEVDKQLERGFYSSTLSKLYKDGLIGHNGKQRGGSRSILTDVEKLNTLVEAQGYIDEDGKVIPESARTASPTKKPKVPVVTSDSAKDVAAAPTPAPESVTEARERRKEEQIQIRRAANFSTNVVSWIGVYLSNAPTKAPTPARVAEAVAGELDLDPEIGKQIVRNLINGEMLFDHRRHRGSKIISLEAPTEDEIRRDREQKLKDEQAGLPQSKYGKYFEGDDEEFEKRFGNVKGVRRSDINFKRGVIKLEGLEKAIVEYFFDSKTRKGVALKQLVPEMARTKNIKVTNEYIEQSVNIINSLAGSEFFVMMPPVAGLKGVKGPRLRLQGSFMEDSHARA